MDQDNTVESLPVELESSIEQLTRELFIASQDSTRLNEQEYKKMENMSTVAMLN